MTGTAAKGHCQRGELDLTEGSVRRLLIRYFIPIWFGSVFQQLYVSVDAAVVGRFAGKTALAAVGGTTTLLLDLSLGFFIGFTAGAGVVISQYYGAKDRCHLRISVQSAMYMSFAFGVMLTFAGRALTPAALKLMRTPPDVVPEAASYLRLYYLGAVPSLLYNMGSGVLRAAGDSGRPMYFLAFSTVLNIVLDIFMVAGLGMGVCGAALATVISQTVSALLVLMVLLRTGDPYRLEPGPVRDPSYTGISVRMLELGLPSGIQYMLYTVANLIVQARINTFGTDPVAAWTAYSKLDGIFWMTMMAFGTAITTFAGQNAGAGRMDRVKESVREGALLSFGLTAVICAVLLMMSRELLGLFTKDETVLEQSMHFMALLVPTYFLYTGTELLGGVIKGLGDSFTPMMITGISAFGIRSLWAVLAPGFVPGIDTVALSYPVSWGISTLLFAVWYLVTAPCGRSDAEPKG